jgi:hypothetical protein
MEMDGQSVLVSRWTIVVSNAHEDKVKLTFSQGASLPDPDKLFNNGFEGNRYRAFYLYEGDSINERALNNLCMLPWPSTWPG